MKRKVGLKDYHSDKK